MDQMTHTFPLTATPEKHFQNVVTLLEHSIKMQRKKDKLASQLKMLCDKDCDIDKIDEIDKIEEEMDFLNNYINTLQNQAVVIINENNVTNLPSLESLEKSLPLLDLDIS